jgi:acyl-coenzyme A synthetase/AMP-(fatty) acid ligase
MLYELWRQISSARRNEWALRNFASGQQWTFGELFEEGAKFSGSAMAGTSRCDVREFAGSAPASGAVSGASPENLSSVIFPTGHTPKFIFQLLAAWREGRPVCPLEVGQAPPQITEVPPNCVHFKCTSATAGASRLVALTAEQLAADAENIVVTMGLRPDWPNLGVISLAHSYGFSNLVLPLLLHGIPLILAPAPLPEIIRRAGELEKAITIPAVPAMWRAWHGAGTIPKSVKLAISAGAPLPLPLEQEIYAQRGLKIHNFLGASECGGIAYDATATPREDGAMAGTAMRNVELSLDEEGCLTVRSRAVGATYWPEPISGSPKLGNGVFHSSDLAELEQGKVILRGRMGDVINVAGRKVSPETIERELLACAKVRECVVLGLPSRDTNVDRTEIIAAVVVSDAGETELKKFLLDKLPAWQMPREWLFVDSVMTNARGKVSRAEWRKRFNDG